VTHANLHLVVRLDGDCDRLLLAREDGGRHFESSSTGT
jgi:phosphomannomutase